MANDLDASSDGPLAKDAAPPTPTGRPGRAVPRPPRRRRIAFNLTAPAAPVVPAVRGVGRI